MVHIVILIVHWYRFMVEIDEFLLRSNVFFNKIDELIVSKVGNVHIQKILLFTYAPPEGITDVSN